MMATTPPAVVVTIPAADETITAKPGTWIRFRAHATNHPNPGMWGIGPASPFSINAWGLVRGRVPKTPGTWWVSAFNTTTGGSGSVSFTVVTPSE